jgi:hypothetical protein
MNGIMSLQNHVDAKPCHCCKKVWEWSEQFNAKKRKGNQQQINKICLWDLSQKNLLWKIPSKNKMCNKKIPQKLMFLDCEKQFVHPFCGKYLSY